MGRQPVHSGESTRLVLQAQVVVALLCVLVLLLALSMLVHRALVLAISLFVPFLHAAPTSPRMRSTLIPPRTTTPAAVGYPRSASPALASPSGRRQGQQQRHARARAWASAAAAAPAVPLGPRVNRSDESTRDGLGSRPRTMQLREQPNNRSSEGEPPYVGEFHRPVENPSPSPGPIALTLVVAQ
jgi:hypothetical protein